MKYAYVGCRTTKKRNARGKGLMVYEIRPDGLWEEKQCLFVKDNPSYQCLDLEKKYLYSVHGDLTLVSSYEIQEDGTLKHLNTIDIGGKNPVDVTVDKENRHVIVATLQGGTLYTIKRNPDGSLGEICSTFTYEGKEEGHSPVSLGPDQGLSLRLRPGPGQRLRPDAGFKVQSPGRKLYGNRPFPGKNLG